MGSEEYWAIQEIATGKLLTLVRGNYSTAEFSDYGTPRLFVNKRSAIAAHTAWLQGWWTVDRTDNGLPYPMNSHKRDPKLSEVVAVYLRWGV